jgi:uncharacterized repeat protein (TIGR01451 family)
MKLETKSLSLDEMLKNYLDNAESLLCNPIKSAKTIIPLGSALLAGMNAMDAQIVYSGTQNINCGLAGNTNRCYANINLAGGNDFEIHRNHAFGNQFIQVDEVAGGGFSINGFHAKVQGTYVYPYANAAGVTIGPSGPWGFQAGQANSLSEVNNAYPNDVWTPLANGTTRFVGIRGTLSGQTRYGWIRLTKNGFGNYTIVDWAYNATPNAPIMTGQTASLTADISVVKTVNDNTPDQNQVVTFTLIVTNAGPNPATSVEVTDVVPTGFSYVAGSQSGPGTYVNGAPATIGLKWQNLFIGNGSSVTLTFQATVTGTPGSTITNFAQVTASAEVDPDSTPNNGNIGEDDGDTETVIVNLTNPTSSVLSIDDSAICAGETANLKVAITGGTSPYQVIYSDGMSNFTVNNYTSNTNIPVSPSASKTYSLVSVKDANNLTGTGNTGMPSLTVNTGSTAAVLSIDDNAICAGQSANLKVLITGGTGPFSVVYSDGMSNFTVNGYASNSNIPVSPTSNKMYSLVSVTDANLCLGMGNTGSPAITVSPSPISAVLGVNGVSAICAGQTANLKVDIVGGTGPFNLVLNDGTNNIPVNGYTSGANIPVMPLSTTNYSLVSVTDANMCNPASLSGTPAIGVSNGSSSAVLSTNGPTTACPGGTINLKVTIMGGVGPYLVVYTDGMTNFNVPGYTSGANIPVMPLVATNYALVSVTDANNCPGTGNSGSVMATVGYETQQDGDYNNPATWAGGCVPPSMIPVGVTLTILHQVTNTGVITLNGVISSPTGTFINNGTVKGTGTVLGSFINNGTLNPGN